MTKKEMIEAILSDMDKKCDTSRETLEKMFKGFLNRQSKAEVEQIMHNRGIK